MISVNHVNDLDLYTKLVSELNFDNDTLVYNELTEEMFRYVKQIQVNHLENGKKNCQNTNSNIQAEECP